MCIIGNYGTLSGSNESLEWTRLLFPNKTQRDDKQDVFDYVDYVGHVSCQGPMFGFMIGQEHSPLRAEFPTKSEPGRRDDNVLAVPLCCVSAGAYLSSIYQTKLLATASASCFYPLTVLLDKAPVPLFTYRPVDSTECHCCCRSANQKHQKQTSKHPNPLGRLACQIRNFLVRLCMRHLG
ncbi:hypothetical protein VTK56DRAFT_7344 [Thermocarpiscus australiensis]